MSTAIDLEPHFRMRQGCSLEFGPEDKDGGVRIEVNWGTYGYLEESPYHRITKTFIEMIQKYHEGGVSGTGNET